MSAYGPKQTWRPAYSITSSARTRIDGGMASLERLSSLGCVIVQRMVDMANASGGRLFAAQPTGYPGSSNPQQYSTNNYAGGTKC